MSIGTCLPGIYVAGDSADPFDLHPPNSRRPGTCREHELKHKKIDWPKLAAVMGFYFLATFLALAITFYISFLVDPHGNQNSFSGLLVSLFFLAIMLPGFFLSPIIRRLRGSVNLVSLIMICAGLLFIGLFKAHFWLIAGCTLVGLGYGIIQPIIYDKAAVAAPPQSATLALRS